MVLNDEKAKSLRCFSSSLSFPSPWTRTEFSSSLPSLLPCPLFLLALSLFSSLSSSKQRPPGSFSFSLSKPRQQAAGQRQQCRHRSNRPLQRQPGADPPQRPPARGQHLAPRRRARAQPRAGRGRGEAPAGRESRRGGLAQEAPGSAGRGGGDRDDQVVELRGVGPAG